MHVNTLATFEVPGIDFTECTLSGTVRAPSDRGAYNYPGIRVCTCDAYPFRCDWVPSILDKPTTGGGNGRFRLIFSLCRVFRSSSGSYT